MTRNYDEKLSAEIMTRNYQLVYYRSENVGIIGILTYPKMTQQLIFNDIISILCTKCKSGLGQ